MKLSIASNATRALSTAGTGAAAEAASTHMPEPAAWSEPSQEPYLHPSATLQLSDQPSAHTGSAPQPDPQHQPSTDSDTSAQLPEQSSTQDSIEVEHEPSVQSRGAEVESESIADSSAANPSHSLVHSLQRETSRPRIPGDTDHPSHAVTPPAAVAELTDEPNLDMDAQLPGESQPHSSPRSQPSSERRSPSPARSRSPTAVHPQAVQPSTQPQSTHEPEHGSTTQSQPQQHPQLESAASHGPPEEPASEAGEQEGATDDQQPQDPVSPGHGRQTMQEAEDSGTAAASQTEEQSARKADGQDLAGAPLELYVTVSTTTYRVPCCVIVGRSAVQIVTIASVSWLLSHTHILC